MIREAGRGSAAAAADARRRRRRRHGAGAPAVFFPAIQTATEKNVTNASFALMCTLRHAESLYLCGFQPIRRFHAENAQGNIRKATSALHKEAFAINVTLYTEPGDPATGTAKVPPALEKFFSKGSITLPPQVKDILKNYTRYPTGTRKLLFTSNHDENTYYGTEYEKYGAAAEAMAVFTCSGRAFR